jgi:hypothetical protein
MANYNPKQSNLKPFKKGYDERRHLQGRARTYISTLKNDGYKLSEVNDCILVLMSMTIDELREVFESPTSTILEKTICNAMMTSLKRGSLYSMETLISRVWGTPKQTSDVSMQMQFKVEAPNEHTKNLIENL